MGLNLPRWKAICTDKPIPVELTVLLENEKYRLNIRYGEINTGKYWTMIQNKLLNPKKVDMQTNKMVVSEWDCWEFGILNTKSFLSSNWIHRRNYQEKAEQRWLQTNKNLKAFVITMRQIFLLQLGKFSKKWWGRLLILSACLVFLFGKYMYFMELECAYCKHGQKINIYI